MRIERVTLGGVDTDPVSPRDGCFDQRLVLGWFGGRSRSGDGRVHHRKCREWSDICRLACVGVKVVWLPAWSCGPRCL